VDLSGSAQGTIVEYFFYKLTKLWLQKKKQNVSWVFKRLSASQG
jgi:hypothetical protein